VALPTTTSTPDGPPRAITSTPEAARPATTSTPEAARPATTSTPEAARPATTAAPNGRLAWLDALRGIAALAVVCDHMIFAMPVFRALRGPAASAALGQYGVFVFFLVSGYIVPASLERKGSVRSFWVSRVFRLYPLYLLASAALVALALIHLGSLAGGGQHPVSSVLGHLLMMSNVLDGPNAPYTVWTLSYEMVFYILLTALFLGRAQGRSGSFALGFAVLALGIGGLLPTAAISDSFLGFRIVDLAADALVIGGLAVAALSRHRLPRLLGGALAAVTVLTLMAFNEPAFTTPSRALAILALMFTGTLIFRAEHGQVSKVPAAAGITAVFTLTLASCLWNGTSGGLLATLQTQEPWLISISLAGLTFLAGITLRNRRVPAMLAWLGLVSYSVYLLHPLLLGIYTRVPWLVGEQSVPMELLTAGGLLAAVLVVSTAAYRSVEAPAQRLGRRLNRYLDARLGADRVVAGLAPGSR